MQTSMLSPKKLSPLIDSNKMSMFNNIKEFFSEDEWNAISSAMRDYADYGEDEANVADSIDSKISNLYKLMETK